MTIVHIAGDVVNGNRVCLDCGVPLATLASKSKPIRAGWRVAIGSFGEEMAPIVDCTAIDKLEAQ